MELEFVCHASVIVRTPGTAIWTDPWLFGKAFNDSWSLLPEPSFDLQRLDEIDYLWVSPAGGCTRSFQLSCCACCGPS